MEVVIYMYRGTHIVQICDANSKVIDTIITNAMGIIRYKFPHNGSYNLICVDDPALSIMNREINISPYAGRPQGILGG